MTLPSRFWADLGTRDFARLDPARTIAVLPVAATEQHGPHLPLSVDTVLVDGIVDASLPHLPADSSVLFLPTQAVGLSPEQLVDHLFDYLTGPGAQPGQDLQAVRDSVLGVLLADYLASGARARPRALRPVLPAQGPPAARSGPGLVPRQQQHALGANPPMIRP